MKKWLSCVLILLLITAPVFAQESSDSDITGKKIEDIRFEGTVHADLEILADIADSYIGENYTEELFADIQAELNALQYFSYFYAYADRSGPGNENLIIGFTVKELPFITSLAITGNDYFDDEEILEMINTSEGVFYNSAVLSGDEITIKDAYRNKGFVNMSIVTDVNTDEETDTVEITMSIEENKQSKIDQISFSGNATYSSSSLKRVLTSKEQSLFNKGEYSETNVQLDKNAILQYYRERGYIDAAITDVTMDINTDDPAKDLLTMTYVIDEGEQWKFGGLTTEGNLLFSDAVVQAMITLKKGEPINIVQMQQDISKIADLYWNEGYIYNEIIPKEVRDEKTLSISYEIQITEKQQAYIEDIVIKGNKKTKDFVLYRELSIKVGDIFSKEKFIESVQNLYNTGIIGNVDYDVLFGSGDGQIVLEFIVEESNKVDLQFGATFGGTDEFPVSGFLSWTDKNFTGTGQDFSITTNIASESQSLDFSYQDSWLAQQRWSGGLSFSISHNEYDDILQDADGALFSEDDYYNGVSAPDPYQSYEEYQQAIEDGLSIGDEYLMDYEEYSLSLGLNTGYTFVTDAGKFGIGGGVYIGLSNVSYDDDLYRPYNPIVRNNLDTWLFKNKMKLSLSWDGRDLIENTTRGYMFEESFTYAGGVLGGYSEYLKNSFSGSGYLSLFKLNDNELNPTNIVLSLTSTISNILPQFYSYGEGFGLQDEPIATQSEKLYIDGMNTVRGIDSPVYNLEFMWDTMLSITIPLVKNVLDGDIYTSATIYNSEWQDTFDLSQKNYYFSTGAGIKLDIPGFPLGLYLSKVYYYDDDSDSIVFQQGDVFNFTDSDEGGLNLVLAITYNLY